MNSKLVKIFNKARYEPENELAPGICFNIKQKEKKLVKIRFYFFSFTGILSLIGLVPMIKMLLSDFSQSGLYEYLSIAFSSGGNLASYWRELAFSISESIPVLSIILSFSLCLIFLISLRYALKQIIKSTQLNSRLGGSQLLFN